MTVASAIGNAGAVAVTIVAIVSYPRTANAVTLPYRESFDGFFNCFVAANGCPLPCALTLTAWSNAAGDDLDWTVYQGDTPSANTGPSADHTTDTPEGRYLYTEASCNGFGSPNKVASLITPPLELIGTTAPRAQFWYHMLGSTMGSLHVDVSTDGGMTFTPDLAPPLTSNVDQWQLSPAIDLTPYVGQTIHLRLRGITGTSFESDMAIDDFAVAELNDVGATAVLAPADLFCGTSMTNVTIEVTNFGIAPQPSVPVSIDVTGAASATLVASAPGPIPAGETAVATVELDAFSAGPLTIAATSTLAGDANPANDGVSAMRTLKPTEVPTAPVEPLCPGESATLVVDTPELGITYSWYDAPTMGTELGAGPMFTTPAVSVTTDFWVQREPPSPDHVGPVDGFFGTGLSVTNMDHGLVFDVTEPVTIDQVYVYPSAHGDVVVNVLDSMDELLQTATVYVSTILTKTKIPLDFTLQPGTGYRMTATGTTTGGLFRNDFGAVYPYTGAGITINDTINGFGTGFGYYYFFYDWRVSSQVCSDGRTQVSVAIASNCPTDVGVTLSDDPDPATPGGTVQLVATVSGMSSVTTSEVSLRTTLPAELTNPVTTGCAEDPGGVPLCTLGDLMAQGTASFTIDVEIDPAATGAVESSVTVSTTNPDTNPANDTATASTTIVVPPGPIWVEGYVIEKGCGCSVPGSERRISPWALLAVAGAAGLARRRRPSSRGPKREGVLAPLAVASLVYVLFSGCGFEITVPGYQLDPSASSASAGGDGGASSVSSGGGGNGGGAGSAGEGGAGWACGVDCSEIPAPRCKKSQCNLQTMECEMVNESDGTGCLSADACIWATSCMSGQCVGSPADCSNLTQGCEIGVCSPSDGTCTTEPLAVCTSGDGCCPTGCTASNDVDCTPKASCKAIKMALPASTDGVYAIDLDGPGPDAPFNVYCDMTADGGGWTLLAWTADSTVAPFGVPYPGLAPCTGLECARGSVAAPPRPQQIIRAATELAETQFGFDVTTFGPMSRYQFAGKYVYPSLAAVTLNYGPTTCTLQLTGTFTMITGPTMYDGTPMHLDLALAASVSSSLGLVNYSSDAAEYNWSIGMPNSQCLPPWPVIPPEASTPNAAPPGSLLGTWRPYQQGPAGGGVSPGAYSVWAR